MMHKSILVAVVAASTLLLTACQDQASSGGNARDYISAVGSSTAYPFAPAVPEKFAEATGSTSPTIFSHVTGGGFDRICLGVGPHPTALSTAPTPTQKPDFKQNPTN